ncbi:hypothetical protein ACJVQT_20185 [Enterobacter huaxiensis]|uniref:hypothetical protein n=1 Tax=Enterobacter huaxiensis TaxID=2494702 RepID=UPI0021758277|nr:hypothetical protein [Enterobacter huaxiensis]MCS5452284.1 hypothetical protein [Enterobacter huaxiensis]
MYECLKLPFNEVKVDKMSDDDECDASYIRMTYKGFYFYLSYHLLRPATPIFNSIECIAEKNNLYIIAIKISQNSYKICWLGDCDCIEFRMRDTEKDRGSFGLLSLILGMVSFALAVGAYNSFNTDSFIIYFAFLFFTLIFFIITFLEFIETSSDKSIQLKKLMRKNLMHEKGLFSTFTSSFDCCQLEPNIKIPKELCRRTVIVESVCRKRRKINGQYYNTASNTSMSTSYTKCMINIVCDGEKFTFEYKESGGEIAPFIAKGDKIILYWYEAKYEEIPNDREDIAYGVRLICLQNITTNNFYKSRLNIEPGNIFKVVQSGGKDIYNNYSLY